MGGFSLSLVLFFLVLGTVLIVILILVVLLAVLIFLIHGWISSEKLFAQSAKDSMAYFLRFILVFENKAGDQSGQNSRGDAAGSCL